MRLFREKDIPMLVTIITLISIIILVALFILFFIEFQKDSLEKEKIQLKRDFIAKNRVEITKEVNRAIDLIDIKFKSELERIKRTTLNKVQNAYSFSNNFYNEYKSQQSEKEIKEIIKSSLKAYSHSSYNGYYFILSDNKRVLFKSDENKSTYISQSDFEAIKEFKEGFINRNFLNPNNIYQDITYLKEFELFKWYIGYSDFVDVMKREMKEELKDIIGNIKLSNESYLFIIEIDKDKNSRVLINKNRGIEDKSIDIASIKNLEEKPFLQKDYQTLLRNGEVYIDYTIPKRDKVEKRRKISYLKIYRQLNWIIGGSFYVNDVNFLINQLEKRVEVETEKSIKIIIIASLIFIFIVLIFSIILSIKIGDIFVKYRNKVIAQSEQLEELKESIEEKVEERTSKIQQKSMKVWNASREDNLTKLPNYIVFHEDLRDTIDSMIILLNIDHFDAINNTYGMLHGDKVLFLTAKKLQMLIPNNAKLYRLDSNEFAIILAGDEDRARMIAKKIDRYFDNHPISYNRVDIKINFTFGATRNRNSESLYHAKIALKEGKIKGRKKFVLYDESSTFAKQQKLNVIWTHKLKEAIEQDRIVPYFQPIVDNLTRKVVKYEVLVRIIENNKVISPFNFMSAAKTTRFLNTITQSVIKKSFEYFQDKNVNFSINLTEDDLRSDNLSEILTKSARMHQIRPSRVTLEILENITLSGSKVMTDKINELKDLGFIIAIDDFGSESSNYSRLTEINANIIKIDGMYIKNIAKNPKDLKIVKSIVYLAKALGAETIAEFVHNETVYKIVTRLGIDYSQGYYFSPPQPKIGPSVL